MTLMEIRDKVMYDPIDRTKKYHPVAKAVSGIKGGSPVLCNETVVSLLVGSK